MKLPKSAYNWLSVIGSVIAILNLALIVLLFIISSIFNQGSSYLGLFIFMVLPAMMFIGLILIPIGMWIQIRREKRNGLVEAKKLPYIDLNNRRHRNAFLLFFFCTVIFLFLTAAGSFEAYHYTESIPFCGKLCHKVMEPEYTAFQNSPHASILCVDCHVGPGTDWYVRSKISGLYQVYAVLANVYPRPIPTPITSLRPARETCQRCHWPQKFYSRKLQVERGFLADSVNTEWDVYLQMKIGPQFSALGLREGIHWHINPNVSVEYISDPKRENIYWVKYTNKATGETHIYKNDEEPVADSVMKSSPQRTMDCIDCHNRPSHQYKSPPTFVDNAMIAGAVPSDIPYIKYIAMQVLKDSYSTKDSAFMAISKGIIDFYKTDHADYYASNQDKITQAINGIEDAYSRNVFPFMKVDYLAYPDHIGHLQSRGCFRCHNDKFKSEQGRVISRDCNMCHTIIGQGKPGSMQMVPVTDTLEFMHPVDIKGVWKTSDCSECHNILYQ
jgi:hypothetical protein